MSRQRGLGKGLGSLIAPSDTNNKLAIKIKLADIVPNPYQPRLKFDQEAIENLALSIERYGLVQPIIVRREGDKYQLVAGERRFRACQKLKMTEIDAIIKEYSTAEVSEIALIENIERADLDPIEEACAYDRLMTTFKYTQHELAEKFGRSRSYIANMVRLLSLAEPVKNALSAGEVTIGQVRPLLILEKDEQINILTFIIENELSARQVEELLKKRHKETGEKNRKTNPYADNIELKNIIEKLKFQFGSPVNIKINSGKGVKGRIEINFSSEDELERLLSTLMEEKN